MTSSLCKRKAVFMDKDGTLIPDIPFNVNPDLITISEDAIDAIRWITDHGFLLIIVSNQPGIARGYFDDEAIQLVWEKINALLAERNLAVDAFYYCPHDDSGVTIDNMLCNCRKPKAGMLLEAAKDFNIDLSRSWMVGDILNDVEAGNRAGCSSVLLNNGNETEWKISGLRRPVACISRLRELPELLSKTTNDEKSNYQLPGYYQSVQPKKSAGNW